MTPGAILLGLLKNAGMPEVTIGAWRGAMAVSGALGTFLAPWLLKRKGIVAAAKITIIGMQTAMSSAAVLYILRNSFTEGLQLFLLPVTFSRMFLYAYDLVEVQVSLPRKITSRKRLAYLNVYLQPDACFTRRGYSWLTAACEEWSAAQRHHLPTWLHSWRTASQQRCTAPIHTVTFCNVITRCMTPRSFTYLSLSV